MDLKSFVAESLIQIVAGIKEAQARPGGDDIAAAGYFSSQGSLISAGTSGFFTMVDFDVSVIAEAREGGSVRVASVEVSDSASKSSHHFSRVKFSVHVRLPEGGALRGERADLRHNYESDGF